VSNVLEGDYRSRVFSASGRTVKRSMRAKDPYRRQNPRRCWCAGETYLWWNPLAKPSNMVKVTGCFTPNDSEEPREPIHQYTLLAFESMQIVSEIEARVRSETKFSLARSPGE
jgi:hypothetical protein